MTLAIAAPACGGSGNAQQKEQGIDMYSLKKFRGRVGNIGKPLPDPFPVFGRNRVSFRQGSTSMIAGKPGSFKSTIALNMAVYWATHGQDVLYFSADSDEMTVVERISGLVTGDSTQDVERAFSKDEVDKYTRALSQVEYMRFVYRQMDMESIAKQVFTFDAVYGDFPHVIFIDNLVDFVDRPDDWGGMLTLTKEFDSLARETKSHICILHHAKINKEAAIGKAPADWEVQGMVLQKPALVLTIGAGPGYANVACVKNRHGQEDPQAQNAFYFEIDESLRFHDRTQHREQQTKSLMDSFTALSGAING